MEGSQNISLFIAFSAGFLSFVSPCVLPLIPSYVSYITGLSVEDLSKREDKKGARAIIIKNSLMFILGFSSIFVSLGASASFIGGFLNNYQDLIRKVGGVLVIFFGLYIMGLLKLKFLSVEKKIHLNNKPMGYVGSFLVGLAFAAGWTPCIGPILGSILVVASMGNSIIEGAKLLVFYALGLGLPFLVTALVINTFLSSFKKFHNYLRFISFISGIFLVIVGILVYTNYLSILTVYLQSLGVGWSSGF